MIAIRGTSRTDCRESRREPRNEYTLSGPLLRCASAPATASDARRLVHAHILGTGAKFYMSARVSQATFSAASLAILARAKERKTESRAEETRLYHLIKRATLSHAGVNNSRRSLSRRRHTTRWTWYACAAERNCAPIVADVSVNDKILLAFPGMKNQSTIEIFGNGRPISILF